ncbi:PAS domain-containing protein [Pedobacter polaris]|uniref:PAS domain-containing protein n=1 Tax=Pedobacter polaris TaxID=2571273 RepID=A0A4U1CMR7_9SPHI|nr:PAS domain-containing protein [Pedobacter polaris]TKC06722.1 PAS domain-containing protein [Pedobacter polaris]
MAENDKSYQQLKEELEEIQYQLEEARDTIDAIRSGEIDALVINGDDGHQIYTLKSADQTYRIFIEQMTQGAITIDENGKILYSNSQFALLINQPLEKVIGQSFYNYIAKDNLPVCIELIDSAWENILTKGELKLASSLHDIPVLLSLKTLDLDEGISLSIILTDLTEQKNNQQLLEEKNRQLQEAEQVARRLNVNLEETVKLRTLDLEQVITAKVKITEDLYESEQRLSKILGTMAEGVWIVDINNELVYANNMAKQLLGVSEDLQNPGKYNNPKWDRLKLDGTLLKPEENPIYLAMQTGKPIFDYEIAIQVPGKELLYIAVNAVSIYDENEKLSGGLGTFIDVTQRRKAI